MTRYSKIALGYTAAFGLLVGTAVASADVHAVDTGQLPAADTLTVILEPVNESAASGVATLQETESGETALELQVHGAAAEEPLVALLVTGTCEDPGEVRAPLGAIERGEEGDAHGLFVLGDGLDAVVSTPTIVQIQAEGAEVTPIACGQIVADADPFGEPAMEAQPEPLPEPEPEPLPEPQPEPLPDPLPEDGDDAADDYDIDGIADDEGAEEAEAEEEAADDEQ